MAADGFLSVDIPLPGGAIKAEIKCKCGQTVAMNIINKLQGSRSDWPAEDRGLIDWDEVKYKAKCQK